jgi:hypothetical protein
VPKLLLGKIIQGDALIRTDPKITLLIFTDRSYAIAHQQFLLYGILKYLYVIAVILIETVTGWLH